MSDNSNEQVQENLTPEAEGLLQIVGMAKSDPSFIERNPEYKEAVEEYLKLEAGKETPKGDESAATEEYSINGEAIEKDAIVEKVQEMLEKGEDISTILIADDDTEAAVNKVIKDFVPTEESKAAKKAFSKKSGKEVKFSSADEFNAYAEKTYGIKIDTPEGLAKFVNTANTWRNQSQGNAEVTEKLEGFNKLFDEMPDDIYQQVDAWANGKDWTQIERIPKVSATKDWDSLSIKQQLNLYNSDDFDEKDIQDYLVDEDNADEARAIKIALKAGKKQYESDQNKIKSKRANFEAEVKNRKIAIKNSADGSVKYLKEAFPDIEPDMVKSVKNILVSGDSQFNDLFKNKDGTWKKEASERILLAIYGKEELDAKNSIIGQQSNDLLDVVKRSSKKPSVSKSTQKPPSELLEKLQKIQSMNSNKDPYKSK